MSSLKLCCCRNLVALTPGLLWNRQDLCSRLDPDSANMISKKLNFDSTPSVGVRNDNSKSFWSGLKSLTIKEKEYNSKVELIYFNNVGSPASYPVFYSPYSIKVNRVGIVNVRCLLLSLVSNWWCIDGSLWDQASWCWVSIEFCSVAVSLLSHGFVGHLFRRL